MIEKDWRVYAFGKGTIATYKPSDYQIREAQIEREKILINSRLKHAILNFIRTGLGSNLEDL